MTFAGVVPAAGASRRMGAPKATLRLGTATFIEHVVRALVEGGCTPVFVVTSSDVHDLVRDTLGREDALGRGNALGRPALDDPAPLPVEPTAPRVRILSNPAPGEGPITSLRLAIEAMDPEPDGVAYLPLDYPLVTPAVVERLLAAARRSDAPLTLPVHGSKRGHPAIFRRSLFGELLDRDLTGGARTVVHRHLDSACRVDFDDPAVITDVDTPDAYARLVRRYEEGVRS